ncbi:MAG: alpha/beta hydrolase fold domain-containing protein [Actinomycetota bacterium]
MPMPDFANDPRLDPRVAAILPLLSSEEAGPSVTSREQAIADSHTPGAIARREMMKVATDSMDTDETVPFAGTSAETMTFTSSPDGNTVPCHVTRPDGASGAPCIVYLHGGGMATSSAFDGNYRAFNRMMAQEGAVVVGIDFRNSVVASASGEVAPYPAGLNDCVSGVRWVAENADALGVDPSKIVVAGESGGGNLTIATGMRLAQDGDAGLVAGLYALCPYIALSRDGETYPSAVEFDGYFLRVLGEWGRYSYGEEPADARDPIAWPSFATAADVAGLPPTVIRVNECDPLRDEGISFYRTLLAAGVNARCETVMGTMHGTEAIPNLCPEISTAAARDMVALANG